MSTKKQREEDIEWLNKNHPDFIKYYPNTRRVQLSNLTHYSVDLMRKGKSGPINTDEDEVVIELEGDYDIFEYDEIDMIVIKEIDVVEVEMPKPKRKRKSKKKDGE